MTSGSMPEAANGGQSCTPAITVVIPAFNEADLIGQAIDSVIAQTFTDFELLVIDDGSDDATAEIARSRPDDRISVHSFDNRGLAASRNRGIRKARGALIAFLDADDFWLPEKLARQHQALHDHPEAALVYSWTDCIDEQRRFLRHGSHVNCSGRVYEQLLVRNFLDNGSSAMVRKSIFDEIGLFNEEYGAGEDWDMWLRIAIQYPFTCVPIADIRYRIRKTSMMSNVERQFEFVEKVLHKGLERLPPSAEKEQLRRTATANIYRYLTVRLVETASGHRAGRQAARYWWRFVSLTNELRRHGGKALLLAPLIIAMLLLPASWYNRLRNQVVAIYGRWSAAGERVGS